MKVMQITTLQVTGMNCSHCENAVTTALKDIGVAEVRASAKNNTVDINFDPNLLGLDNIKAEIAEAGYNVV